MKPLFSSLSVLTLIFFSFASFGLNPVGAKHMEKLDIVSNDTTAVDSLKTKLNELETRLKAVLEEESNSVIGRIKLASPNVKVESYDKSSQVWALESSTINIDTVQLSVKNGVICELRVVAGSDVFYNTKAPISLLRFRKRTDAFYNNQDTRRIFLQDFLDYTAEVGNNYVPDDSKKITIDNGKPVKVLYAKNSLNSLVDYRIYTDFFGLINKESNGIIQFEAKAKMFLNTNNWPDRDIIWFNQLNPFVNFSKFDSSVKSVQLEGPDSASGNFGVEMPMSFIQKSYLNVGGALDIVSIGQNISHVGVNINVGMNINLTSVALSDSTKAEGERISEVDYSSFTVFGGFTISARRLDNFGMNLGLHALRIRPMGDPRIEPFDTFWGLRTTSELFFFTDEDRDKSIFFRFNYVNDLDTSLTSDFFQLQIGYKAPLSFSKPK